MNISAAYQITNLGDIFDKRASHSLGTLSTLFPKLAFHSMKQNSSTYTSFTFLDTELYLLPEKAIYWPDRKALLLADLHIGKSGHFRQHGIPVSSGVRDTDLGQLERIYHRWRPEYVYFLGDLFHSTYNQEWEHFCEVVCAWEAKRILIKGNHDILKRHHYEQAGLDVEHEIHLAPFLLRHEPLEEGNPSDTYILAGHVHPGVRLIGGGRQKLRLPCFHFGENQAILPAFGHFTGLYIIEPDKGDPVFAIVEDHVMRVQ